jgi:hypothetical protein
VTAADVDAAFHGQPFADEDYRVGLEADATRLRLHAGEVTAIDVLVTNRGSRTLPPHGQGQAPVLASYRWNGTGEGLRTPLPEALPPGGATRVAVSVAAPDSPGRYALTVDLVHENVRWFDAGVEFSVEVTDQRRVGIHGEDEQLQLRVAEALTELRPTLEPVLLTRDPASTQAGSGYAAARSAHEAILRESSLKTLRLAIAFDELPSTITDLVVAGRAVRRRERLVQWASGRAARKRGIPVAHAADEGDIERAVRSLPG